MNNQQIKMGLAIGRAIEQELGNRQGERTDLTSGNISLSAGRSSDLAAEKAGLGSGKTYEAAKKVVDTAPVEVVAAMDSGAISINLAAQVADKQQRDDDQQSFRVETNEACFATGRSDSVATAAKVEREAPEEVTQAVKAGAMSLNLAPQNLHCAYTSTRKQKAPACDRG